MTYNKQPYSGGIVQLGTWDITDGFSVVSETTTDEQGKYEIDYAPLLGEEEIAVSVLDDPDHYSLYLQDIDDPPQPITIDISHTKWRELSTSSGFSVYPDTTFTVEDPMPEATMYRWTLYDQSWLILEQEDTSVPTYDPTTELIADEEYRVQVSIYGVDTTVTVGRSFKWFIVRQP